MLLSSALLLVAGAVPRRVVLSAGVATAVALPTTAASARSVLPQEPFVRKPPDFGTFRIGSKVKELATGRTPAQRAEARAATLAAVAADVCSPLSAARDAAAFRALFTSAALLCDGSGPGRPTLVQGAADVGAYLAAQPPLVEPRFTLLSLVPEGEYDLATFVHAEYLCEHAGGASRGTWLLMRASDGAWRVDEAVYPLAAPKIDALLQPRRNEFGDRYYEFRGRV